MKYSSTQVYRTSPTLGGIYGVGSIIYFKEEAIVILPLIAISCALIILIIRPLNVTFRSDREFQFATTLAMILGLTTNYALKNSDLSYSVPAICFSQAFIFSMVVWHYFNPKKLAKLGWQNTDN